LHRKQTKVTAYLKWEILTSKQLRYLQKILKRSSNGDLKQHNETKTEKKAHLLPPTSSTFKAQILKILIHYHIRKQ
jgi:hypothetical protein